MKDIFDELDNMSEEELTAEMNSIMEEVKADPDVANVKVPEDLHDKIFSEIREIEEREARARLSEEDKRLLEYGRRYKRQLKFRKYWILAAAFVLMFAMGITSVGGPQRFLNRVVDKLSGRNQEVVDSNSGIVITDGWDEEQAYEAVEEKFGFYPVRLDYLPEGVVFEGAEIGEKTTGAKLFYGQGERLCIELYIRPNYNDGSIGVDVEDVLIQEYKKERENISFSIAEYLVKKNGESRWKVSFEEKDTYYLIIVHDVKQSQLEEILENIMFM